ncbi:hypothetical protein LCGC14_2631080, partial [marine sediment metagenome]
MLKNPYRAQSKVNPGAERGPGGVWDRRIPTTTFRALLMAGLPGAEYQVVLHIIERTWGFGQESRPISLTEFTKKAYVSRRTVSRAISQLEERRIIVIGHHRREGTLNTYLFNPYWDTWLTEQVLDVNVILEGSGEADTMAENGTSAKNGNSRTMATSGKGGLPDLAPTMATGGKGGLPTPSLAPSAGNKPLKQRKETKKERGNRLLKERDQIFELWNSVRIHQHRGLTDKRSRVILAALKEHTVEEVCQAIITYSKAQFGEQYRWDWRWTLELFINRGLERFIGNEEE